MRGSLFVLVFCLLAVLAASSAFAGDYVTTGYASAPADGSWAPCAKQDYYRSYAPQLRTAPRKPLHVTVAAYLWATDISGTSYADGTATDIDIAFDDLFDKLESAFMGYAEIQYKRWFFGVDASFVSLEQASVSRRGLPYTAQLDQTILDLRLGYRLLCRQVGSSQWGQCCYPRELTVDAVVGARYWGFDQELTFTRPTTGTPATVSADDSWWDLHVGGRLGWQFAKRWGLTVYGDVGGFGIEDSSEFTWELQALVRFQITRGLFLAAGYRALDVDRVTGSGATQNGIDATYHGPVIGLGYRF